MWLIKRQHRYRWCIIHVISNGHVDLVTSSESSTYWSWAVLWKKKKKKKIAFCGVLYSVRIARWIRPHRTLFNVSTRFRRMPTFYCYLCCGDLRLPRVMDRRNGSLGLRDGDDDDDDDDDERWRLVSKMEGKTNFQDTYRLQSGNGIVECLKILNSLM